MYIGSSWDFEDRGDKGEGEGVTHRVDENVWDERGYCFVCKNQGAERLSDHCEVGVSRSRHPLSSVQRHDVNCLRIEMNIESTLKLERKNSEIIPARCRE